MSDVPEAPAAPASPVIEVVDLVADYRTKKVLVPALRGISLTVGAGEILGVMGESGSGKTTLARLLAGELAQKGVGGFELQFRGSVTVCGVPLQHPSSKDKRRLGAVVAHLRQDAGSRLVRTSTAGQNIASPVFARDRHFAVDVAERRVLQLLEAVKLPSDTVDKFPYELSDGQRQRVAIAQSLVLGPQLLIADEPTAGIDATVRESVVDVIGRLRLDPGFAAVLVTHDLGVLRRLGATVAIMHEGALVGYGPVETVFDAPLHSYVRQLGEALRSEEKELPDLDSNQEPAG